MDDGTVTLSNVADDNVPLTWLLTASPIVMLVFIDNDSVSTTVQVLPSAEVKAVIVVPARTSFSHSGAPPVAAA